MRRQAGPRVRGSTAAALAAWLAAGCAASVTGTQRPTVTTPEVSPRSGELDLAVVPRPTGDALLLSLWIDAGCRDAPHPQIATVAARLAADAIGPGAAGVTHPDGIELTVPCSRAELPRCIAGLGRGLSLRRPSAGAVQQVVRQLQTGRRQRAAADPAAAADVLALRAVLGRDAIAWLPLGDASSDTQVTAEAVADFLARHFGEARGLLVAAGELPLPVLSEAAAAHFRGRIRASSTRATRTLPSPRSGGPPAVRVAPDTAAHGSLAIVGPTRASVLGTSLAIRDEIDGDGGVGGHVVPVRGGAVGLLRVGDRDPQAVATAVAWLGTDAAHTRPPARGSVLDGVWDASRMLGLRWVAGEPPASAQQGPTTTAIGLGFTRAEGPGDGSARRDRALQRAVALQEALGDRLTAPPRALLRTPATIENDARVSGALAGGITVEVARETGPMAGIAVRFAGGPSQEPPTTHGRSALLAQLAARHCDGMAAGALRARLRGLGAQLNAHVDPDGWGIELQIPAQHTTAGLRLAMRCALSPSLSTAHVASVAAALRAARGQGPGGRMAAEAARLVAPASPGQVAPGGARGAFAGIGAAELRRALDDDVVAARMQVAVVSPVPPPQVAAWLGHRLAALPAGSPPQAPETTAEPADTEPAGGAEQLVLWRGPPGPLAGAGARAFARIAAQVLAAGGLATRWHGGQSDARGSWAAVGVVVEPSQQAAVVERVAAAFASASAPDLTAAVSATRARESLLQSRSAAAGSASARAMALLVGHAAAADNACLSVANALWRSTPTVHRVP